VKHYAIAFLTSAALASSVFGAQGGSTSSPFVVAVGQRSFTVTGSVVSVREGSLVVKIDDHGHRIPFTLASSVSTADLRAGSRVAVHYHPTGSTGQVADAVEPAPPRR
jgi:hypothetical protein